ncbi:flagellar hook protein FlgE [Thauera aminoaromatica]|uniref:flagellar hook protein FlgE n=1 Tax=Thauera aminoaromatica TaxID=164330 RepID=UPI002355E622|nr:flagellar hook protein FlgE [Thauera aminoaromatica]MCK6399046.1 flagellar hook protein FlgE [Thauera aminoaromatica]
MSFQQGLSGLSVSSKALDIISNNVANTNTIGFKAGSAIFSDVFAASLTGSISGKQVGVGATLGAVRQTFTQGNLTTTNNPLDLAINGDGFFVVSRENGPDVYTRNGQFELDKEGFIRTPTGERLKGFQSPVTPGALPTPIGGLKDVQVPIVGSQPMPTSRVEIGGNLDANDLSAAQRYPQLFGSTFTFPLPAGENWQDARTYNFSTSIKAYDSLGKSHELTYYFAKVTPTPNDPVNTNENTWKVFTSVDGGYPLGVGTDGSIEDPSVIWSLTFNEKGTVNTPIVGPTAANPLAIPASYTPGADRIRFHVDFSDMRQIGGSYLITELTQDGYTGGELAGVSVGRDGIVTGRYTNGETRELAQLALQTFRNPNALLSIGNNFWEATTESGLTAPSKAGEGVAGVVSAGMIEDANVELTNELVQMIVQQRNYQANAQSIKAQDQVLQTLVNLR